MQDNIENKKISIIEQYHIKIVRLTIFCCIFGIILGFIISTVCKLSGYMEIISIKMMLVIDLFVAIPEVLILAQKSKEVVNNGRLDYIIFKQVKIIMLLIIFVNYYIFVLIQPSEELWYLAFFLAMIEALFLDVKYTMVVNIGLTISIVVVCLLQPLERPGKYMLWQDIFIRGTISTLVMVLIFMIVYCAGNILLRLKEEKEQYLFKYLENVEENQNQIREIKHNLRNQVIALKSIISDKNFEEADRFIGNMISGTENLSLITYTDNIVVNSIINYKMNEAKKFNIKWNVEIQLSKNVSIKSEDLGTILGNLLDNAIEACYLVKYGERKIDLNIYNRNNSIIISIINTKIYGINLEKTWKADKSNHGIGLRSVRKLVAKYNGAMSNEYRGELYEINIILWT